MIRRRLVLAVTVTVALAIGLGSWAIVTTLEHRLVSNVDEQFASGRLAADIRDQIAQRRLGPRNDVIDERRQLAIVVYGRAGRSSTRTRRGPWPIPHPFPTAAPWIRNPT